MIQAEQQLTDTPNVPEEAFIFMGGVGYDEARNRAVAEAIVHLTGHQNILSIADPVKEGPQDGIVIKKYPNGQEYEMTGDMALKNLKTDQSELRYSKLHADRARALIEAIEGAGGKPVDAVFQSVDVSTGILAMHERPDLFKKVVLLDPSSIVKLPSRLKYLKEEWASGNLMTMFTHKKSPEELDIFETKVGRLERFRRMKKSNINGNKVASYVSAQATMLHDIAQSATAPLMSVVASRFDHAYTPQRLLDSLIDLDDVAGFFVSNTRHGLAGKRVKLEQLASVLNGVEHKGESMMDRLHFFSDVADDYKDKIVELVKDRLEKENKN